MKKKIKYKLAAYKSGARSILSYSSPTRRRTGQRELNKLGFKTWFL